MSWSGGAVISRMSPNSDGDVRSVVVGNLARVSGNGPAQALRIRSRMANPSCRTPVTDRSNKHMMMELLSRSPCWAVRRERLSCSRDSIQKIP